MERSHPKGVQPSMRECRLRSGVNLEVALKEGGVKQTWPKRGVGVLTFVRKDSSILFYA
jgi:hypothetical protein